MHTDEFEISIGMEISLCRRLIRGLNRDLPERAAICGIQTEVFCKALHRGRLVETNADFSNCRRDCREIQGLERMLSQYEEKLNLVKGRNVSRHVETGSSARAYLDCRPGAL